VSGFCLNEAQSDGPAARSRRPRDSRARRVAGAFAAPRLGADEQAVTGDRVQNDTDVRPAL
jgi:hypothetical protein